MISVLKRVLSLFFIVVLSFVLFLRHNNIFNDKTPKINVVQDFPEVPQFPKTNLISLNKEVVKNNNHYNGTWQTPDSVPNVVNWYLKDLSANNWIIDIHPTNLNAKDIQYLAAIKGDFYLQLSLIRKSKITEITAEITNKSNKD